MTIKRVWHGWTTPENADTYQNLLHDEVFPGIEAMHIKGCRGIELLRLDRGAEVEFVTIMTFNSLQDVKVFKGEDYTACYVPDAARAVLKRWDETSVHYDLVEHRTYP